MKSNGSGMTELDFKLKPDHDHAEAACAEQASRAACAATLPSHDPNTADPDGKPLWHSFVPGVRAALKHVAPPSEKSLVALLEVAYAVGWHAGSVAVLGAEQAKDLTPPISPYRSAP